MGFVQEDLEGPPLPPVVGRGRVELPPPQGLLRVVPPVEGLVIPELEDVHPVKEVHLLPPAPLHGLGGGGLPPLT